MIRRLLPWIGAFAFAFGIAAAGDALVRAGYSGASHILYFVIGLWAGASWWHNRQRAKIARLVIAARVVAFEDQSWTALRELDQASEAFAADVPWDDEPEVRA